MPKGVVAGAMVRAGCPVAIASDLTDEAAAHDEVLME
jgi:hypothetical protein